jgi:hypothetical protein
MDIEIHTYDKDLVFDLPSASVHDEIQVPDQIELIYEESYIQKAVDSLAIDYYVLTFGSCVAAGVVANWLYDRLKGKKIEKLVIERTEVEIDQGAIKKVIEEKFLVSHNH